MAIKKNHLVIAIAVLVGVILLLVTPLLPMAPMKITRTEGVLFFILALVESAAFTLGLIFAYLAWKPLALKAGLLNKLVYGSIVWLLVSWWPHDRWHTAVGENVRPLLVIEYLFHVTAIIAAAIVAYWVAVKKPSVRSRG